ncbi:MAG TPA: oligopeptide/dipeptide ABC transporter ATP-binding protein [Burkholderiales bacterium]|nr:oligopeptide/dipeptide ABC transporter ATP-binding protein [Burkholderiales bacterium]
MSVEPLLEVRNLVRHFRQEREKLFAPPAWVHAVDGVSFDIAGAETLALVGESGCGKTTVGRLVLGLDAPTSGDVLFQGRAVTALAPREWRAQRQALQMVFQDPLGALDPRMTVAQQVREPLEIHGIGAAAKRSEAVNEMLSAVGLSTDFARRYPHELSGGQQQRVNVARALIMNPRLIVCDEPVSALDVSVQAQVVNLLASLQHERGVAYLFISHDLKVVRHLAHRVAVMYLGQIVELAARETLFQRPLHPYTQALIAAVPVPDPDQRRGRALVHGDPPSPLAPPPGCRFHTRCPLAEPICRERTPALEALPDGHRVACHVALREARLAPEEAVAC